MLEAVEELVKTDFEPRQTIFLAFGHDEEIGGQAGAASSRTVAGITRNPARIRARRRPGCDGGIVPGLKDKAALIGIAEKGYMSVELSALAPGGHSSMPPPSTAVGMIARAVQSLEDHPMPASLDGPAALLFDRLGPEMPFLTKMAIANHWLLGDLIIRQLSQAQPRRTPWSARPPPQRSSRAESKTTSCPSGRVPSSTSASSPATRSTRFSPTSRRRSMTRASPSSS